MIIAQICVVSDKICYNLKDHLIPNILTPPLIRLAKKCKHSDYCYGANGSKIKIAVLNLKPQYSLGEFNKFCLDLQKVQEIIKKHHQTFLQLFGMTYCNAILPIIKRVQGCSQSDALKWVTCALLIFFANMHGSAKSVQQKSITALLKWVQGHVANSGRVFKSHECTPTHRVQCIWRATLVYLFTFFNLFVGLLGIITFDPFYKTNNTLILHALAELQHDFGHSQCYANRTRPPPPPTPACSVCIIANVLNACCTAANAFSHVYY